LAEIKDLEDLERAKEELKDRYGVYPRELRNLLEIIYLKIFLRKSGINSLVVKENKLILRYLANIEVKAKLSRLPSFYQQFRNFEIFKGVCNKFVEIKIVYSIEYRVSREERKNQEPEDKFVSRMYSYPVGQLLDIR